MSGPCNLFKKIKIKKLDSCCILCIDMYLISFPQWITGANNQLMPFLLFSFGFEYPMSLFCCLRVVYHALENILVHCNRGAYLTADTPSFTSTPFSKTTATSFSVFHSCRLPRVHGYSTRISHLPSK